MVAELVLLHGRNQQKKNARELKQTWVRALKQALERQSLTLCLSDEQIHFPYYGDALGDLTYPNGAGTVADVVVMGNGPGDEAELAVVLALLAEIRERHGITEAQLQAAIGGDVVQQGVLNWEWVQAALIWIDRVVPGVGEVSLAAFTRDVSYYLRRPGVRDAIETGVRKGIPSGVPAVVVAHSLGSVVAYSLLKREGTLNGWKIPLFVTLGSPLQVRAIRTALAPNRYPECVGEWFNAMDDRDIVPLHPLDSAAFPGGPPIENKTDVDNSSPDRHGIEGYLGDPVVARRIYDACCT